MLIRVHFAYTLVCVCLLQEAIVSTFPPANHDSGRESNYLSELSKLSPKEKTESLKEEIVNHKQSIISSSKVHDKETSKQIKYYNATDKNMVLLVYLAPPVKGTDEGSEELFAPRYQIIYASKDVVFDDNRVYSENNEPIQYYIVRRLKGQSPPPESNGLHSHQQFRSPRKAITLSKRIEKELTKTANDQTKTAKQMEKADPLMSSRLKRSSPEKETPPISQEVKESPITSVAKYISHLLIHDRDYYTSYDSSETPYSSSSYHRRKHEGSDITEKHPYDESDPISRQEEEEEEEEEEEKGTTGGQLSISSGRQFGALTAFTSDFLVRLRIALRNPVVVFLLIILNAWFAYAALTGFLFNPGIFLTPVSSASSTSSVSSSSSAAASIGSAALTPVGASFTVSGDQPAQPVISGNPASITSSADPTVDDPSLVLTGGLSTTVGGTSSNMTTTTTTSVGSTSESTTSASTTASTSASTTASTSTPTTLRPFIPIATLVGSPSQPAPAAASIRPSSTTDFTEEATDGSGIIEIDGAIWEVLANISSSTFPEFSTPASGPPGVPSILPIPVPRPTEEGGASISWIGSGNVPSPTVAPSYPVLHACLVLGGDVPSCVAQASLYGQLLYEHTINSLQKPVAENATQSLLDIIQQAHPHAQILDKTTEKQPFSQQQQPPIKDQAIKDNIPDVILSLKDPPTIVSSSGNTNSGLMMNVIPSKVHYESEGLPQTEGLVSPPTELPPKKQELLEKFPHAQLVGTSSKPLNGYLSTESQTQQSHPPIIQHILSQVQNLQDSISDLHTTEGASPNVTPAGDIQQPTKGSNLKTPDEILVKFPHAQIVNGGASGFHDAHYTTDKTKFTSSLIDEPPQLPLIFKKPSAGPWIQLGGNSNSYDITIATLMVEDDPSVSPVFQQTNTGSQFVEETPPTVETIQSENLHSGEVIKEGFTSSQAIQVIHPHAEIVTSTGRPSGTASSSINEIGIIHPHGEVLENDPPHAGIIQSLHPTDQLLQTVLLHHSDSDIQEYKTTGGGHLQESTNNDKIAGEGYLQLTNNDKITGEGHLQESTSNDKITGEGHLQESTNNDKITGEGHLQKSTSNDKIAGEGHLQESTNNDKIAGEGHLQESTSNDKIIGEGHLQESTNNDKITGEGHLQESTNNDKTTGEELLQESMNNDSTDHEIQEVHPHAQIVRDDSQSDPVKTESDPRDHSSRWDQALAEERIRNDPKAQMIEMLYPHAKVIPNKRTHFSSKTLPERTQTHSRK